MNLTYLKFELLRAIRNRRFFIFSLVFPLILFFFIAGPNHGSTNLDGTGIGAVTYFMVGMASFGAMGAAVSGGARIAAERQVGWNRQLRLTPLTVRNYFRAKVLTSYLMACFSIILLYAAGLTLGVHLHLNGWLGMTGYMLVALAPFAALGILAGHLLTVDSLGPALGGGMALLALLGGAWGPIAGTSGAFFQIDRLIPSYWLVRSGAAALGGTVWTPEGWIVVLGWTAVLAALTARVYQRDTKKL